MIRGCTMGYKRKKPSKSRSISIKARMRQLVRSRNRLILVRQILIDHSYASYLDEKETSASNHESKASTTLLSSIRNTYQNIMSSRLPSNKTKVEINSDTFQCKRGNLYNIESSVSETEWIASDDIFHRESISDSSNDAKIKQVVYNEKDFFEDVQNKQNRELWIAMGKQYTKDSIDRNSEEICSLCAAITLSKENNALGTHLIKMITDFSGVDVLNYSTSPIACANCCKILLELCDFKQQILEAEKHFKEKNAESLEYGDNSNPKFEYINCNDESTNEDCDNSTEEEDEFIKCNFVRATPRLEPGLDLDDAANKTTLIPTERLISENKCAMEKCETDTFRCITCNNFIIRKYVYSHWCLETKSPDSRVADSYICELCGKKYNLLSSFKRHEISHGAKKHVCNTCGEAFHHASNLRRHLRRHTGSKPFACSYCNRRFTVQWNLSQHERMHTNSLPYKCQLCSTAFRHNVSLKKHIGRSHTANEFARKCSDDSLSEQQACSSIDTNENSV